jgi:hypothetical protein
MSRGVTKIWLDYAWQAHGACAQCRPIGNGSLFEQPPHGFFHLRSDQAPTRCAASEIWAEAKRAGVKP